MTTPTLPAVAFRLVLLAFRLVLLALAMALMIAIVVVSVRNYWWGMLVALVLLLAIPVLEARDRRAASKTR